MTTAKPSPLVTAMRDAVLSNGGKIDRDDYIDAVYTFMTDDGSPVKKESLLTSTYQAGRLKQAGLATVNIGSRKQVWLIEEADAAQNGTSAASSPSATITPASGTPITSTGIGHAPNVYHGIARRNIEDYPEFIQTLTVQESTGYHEQGISGGELAVFAFAFNNTMDTMTQGGTGCGKTMSIKEFAFLTGLPLYRVNGRDGMDFADLVGYMTGTEDSGTTFVDGQLTRAMKYGGIFYLDECNFIKPSVAAGMNQVLDERTLDNPMTGEVIRAHPDFRVVASMNPNYAGTTRMNQATRGRFDLCMDYNYLPAALEAQVIQEQSGTINQEAADELVKFCTDLRKMNANDQFAEPTDVGTRTLVAAMKCLSQFNMNQVLDMVVLPLFDEDDKEAVEQVARGRLSSMV